MKKDFSNDRKKASAIGRFPLPVGPLQQGLTLLHYLLYFMWLDLKKQLAFLDLTASCFWIKKQIINLNKWIKNLEKQNKTRQDNTRQKTM